MTNDRSTNDPTPPATDHEDVRQATTLQRILLDSFSRVTHAVHDTVEGLGAATLEHRLTPDANSIAWLVWHLTRVEDDHLSNLAGNEQVWTSAGWAARFDLDLDLGDLGYGHSSAQVATVRAGTDLLLGYYDAVDEAACRYIGSLVETDADRIIDRSFDPPVTVAVRIVSVISDCLQHAGQASILRGLIESGWRTSDG